MKANILVVDDDVEIRELLNQVLVRAGCQVQQVKDAASLKEAYDRVQPDVVLLDYKLPDATGLDLLPLIKKEWPETEVIMLTGHATYEVAVEAIKRGAFHFQEKPFDPEGLLNLIKKALKSRMLRDAVLTASAIFACEAMQNVVRTVERIAPSDVTILITGESGTGKEVIADLIHALSPRSKNRIIKINCAALPRELIESELFGSKKGAFTGAHTDRDGLFRQAEGGTLFLDEISEMPDRHAEQAAARVAGPGSPARRRHAPVTRPTAASSPPPTASPRTPSRTASCARICSTASAPFPFICRRCASAARTSCRWPTAFLKRFAAQANRTSRGFTADAGRTADRLRLAGQRPPVAERNPARRAPLRRRRSGRRRSVHHRHQGQPSPSEGHDTSFTLLEGVERNAIVQMLKETGGNKLETAKRLGIGRQTLYNKIKAYGIET